MANIIEAITELAALEKRIEGLVGDISSEIKKEKNAKKRRKMRKAFKKRDSAALRALWFR